VGGVAGGFVCEANQHWVKPEGGPGGAEAPASLIQFIYTEKLLQ